MRRPVSVFFDFGRTLQVEAVRGNDPAATTVSQNTFPFHFGYPLHPGVSATRHHANAVTRQAIVEGIYEHLPGVISRRRRSRK
jgi:hypothetical protein